MRYLFSYDDADQQQYHIQQPFKDNNNGSCQDFRPMLSFPGEEYCPDKEGLKQVCQRWNGTR